MSQVDDIQVKSKSEDIGHQDLSEESDSSESSDDSSNSESGSESDSNSSDDENKSSQNSQNNQLDSGKDDDDRSNQQLDDQSDDSENNEDDDKDDDSSDSDHSKDNNRKRSKSKGNSDFTKILERFPDAIRRSSRSRREPERFQAAGINSDSDASESGRKVKRRKRKDSEDWNRHDDDGNDELDEEDENDDGSSDDDGYKRSRRTKKHSRLKKPQRTNRHDKAKPTRSRSDRYNSESSNGDDDDDDDGSRDFSTFKASRKQSSKTSRRTANAKAISYKEESDYTDVDDLMPVDNSSNAFDENGEKIPLEEEGEQIDRILEHRMGSVGATGLKTTPYQVEENGDPNDPNSEHKEMQYLVKWKNFSYIHCTWESKESLIAEKARGIKKIENYLKRDEEIKHWKKYASPEDIDYYECQEELNDQLRALHLNIERVIAHQELKTDTDQSHVEYLCKWEGLPYCECSWEDGNLISSKFPTKIEDYFVRQKSQNIPTKYCKVLKSRPKFVPMKLQPDFIGGREKLKLRDYQLDGLNWLAQSWCKDNSVILADEMGLGKTIQTISFLNYLYNAHSLYGPFLLVVPLSTLTAWQKEFDNWAPEMNVVVYVGDGVSRNMIRSYEWYHPGNGRVKFNALLTTYEILLRDKAFLSSIQWAVLGVDEAHRLKNDESFLYKFLFEFNTNHRLLITGTPLQNSLRELWALLHFIMPDRFGSWEHFEAEHNDSYNKGFSKLHSQIQQFLLRRVKKDVEKSLPAKVEQILRVEMTSIQKQYYKWILTKNYKALTKGLKGSLSSFTNIIMELKKCCNHATLVRPVDEYEHLDPLQRLIRGSGKLLLLDKLLCRLKETGHRVLIFSQMVRMLDLLGEYLSYRRFPYQRLDGSIRGEVRKQALEHFNAEGSQDFCFLLSTRAGGLGINLATADTVIIFDSDWNPQNDLQAQARAHRIGQKNQVNIYRLVTKSSVEEDIIERAKRKMVLDHLIIQRMDTSGRTIMSKKVGDIENSANKNNSTPFNKEELAAILKFGAEDLFKESEQGEGDEPQCDIDEILKRAETRDEDDVPHTLGDELLSSFKMASFNFNEEEDVNAVSTNTSLPKDKDWDDIIPEVDRLKFEEEERQKEEMKILMLPRSRTKNQTQKDGNSNGNRSESDEYDPNLKDSGSEDSDGDRPRRGRGRPVSGRKEPIRGFTEAEIRRFIKSYKKFPNPMKRLESIAIDSELQEKPLPDLQRLATELQNQCELCVRESENSKSEEGKKNNRGPSFKLGGVTVFPRTILTTQKDMEPLDEMLSSNLEERKKWILKSKVKSANWDCSWTVEDDSRLLTGVYEYGYGSWEAIKMDPNYQLMNKILPDGTDTKPQAKQLQSRVDYLLKVMNRMITANQPVIIGASGKPMKVTDSQIDTSPTKKRLNNNSNNKKLKPSDGSKSSKLKSKRKDMANDENKLISDEKRRNKKEKKDKDKKRKDKKRDKKEKSIDGDDADDGGVEMSNEMFARCKEEMRPVKKVLIAMNKLADEKKSKKEKKAFNESIRLIGAHIDRCLRSHSNDAVKSKEWRNNLWTFVSQFTSHRAKKLYKIYRHLNKNELTKSSTSIEAAIDHSSNNSQTNSINNHSPNKFTRHKDSRLDAGYSGSGYKRSYPQSGSSSSFNKFSKHSYRDYPQSSYGSNRSNSSFHSSSFQDGGSSSVSGGGGRAITWASNSSSSNRDNYRSNRSDPNYYKDYDDRRSSVRNDRSYYDRRPTGGGGFSSNRDQVNSRPLPSSSGYPSLTSSSHITSPSAASYHQPPVSVKSSYSSGGSQTLQPLQTSIVAPASQTWNSPPIPTFGPNGSSNIQSESNGSNENLGSLIIEHR